MSMWTLSVIGSAGLCSWQCYAKKKKARYCLKKKLCQGTLYETRRDKNPNQSKWQSDIRLLISCFPRSTQIGLMYHHNPHNTEFERLPCLIQRENYLLLACRKCHKLICSNTDRFVLDWHSLSTVTTVTACYYLNSQAVFCFNAALLQVHYRWKYICDRWEWGAEGLRWRIYCSKLLKQLSNGCLSVCSVHTVKAPQSKSKGPLRATA